MSDITVQVTSALTNSERRVSTNWTLKYFKQRLETITGIPPEDQQLLLFINTFSTDGKEIKGSQGQTDDSTTLDQFQFQAHSRIQVNDTRPESELNDLNNEEGGQFFELKDEDYEKRSDSIRRWKQDNKLGRFDPAFEAKKEEIRQSNESKAKELKEGSRFRTVNDKDGERRGVIRYVGKVPEIDPDSIWVGVQFDEPVGKNNGSIKGVSYFTANQNYGGFLRPVQIEQGDFPEKSLFSDDDDDEI
ncbi:Cell polarity protein alp11 [Wickerhamomyces ciferrii]|uniref:Cell polarity protein alp11 n=1 Tax=Wickerhamomyces ciferrii (strain ATCC 14091 / BCRC 22168 / CBS 111 / JCM 3599 / NBRC 0793 / NRRL Y-1031 F-60-10) TaxID=1206466 RepID=K0KEL2_WICCF|nr:Cell polarity protein alp11 [Wickerhamomyces ciferrii]CCH43575.1 Cell polarity protein alp11 [Wickerhamomyces ciferrii]